MSNSYQSSPAHTGPSLEISQSAYQAASRSLARLDLLCLLVLVIGAALFFDEVYIGWALSVMVALAAVVFAERAAARLFRSFEEHFQKVTGLNYTAVRSGAAVGNQLTEFVHAGERLRWERTAWAVNWAAALCVAAAFMVLTLATIQDVRAGQSNLHELDARMVPSVGARFEAELARKQDETSSVEDRGNPNSDQQTPRQPETRLIPVDPKTGAQIITDVLIGTLPGMRKLEQDLRAARTAAEEAQKDPTKAATAASSLLAAANDAWRLAQDPNISVEDRKELEEYAEAAKNTLDSLEHEARVNATTVGSAQVAGGSAGTDDFVVIGQTTERNCGPTSVQMVINHLTNNRPDIDSLGRVCGTWLFAPPEGLVDGYHDCGYQAEVVKVHGVKDLYDHIDRGHYPIVIVRADNGAFDFHYLVAYGRENARIMVADPSPENVGMKFSDAAMPGNSYLVAPSIDADRLLSAMKFECAYEDGRPLDPGFVARVGQRGHLLSAVVVTGKYNPLLDLPGQLLRDGISGLENGRTLADIGLGFIKFGELVGNNPLGYVFKAIGEVARFLGQVQRIISEAISILLQPIAALFDWLGKLLGINLGEGDGSGGNSGGGTNSNGSSAGSGSSGGQTAGQVAGHSARVDQLGQRLRDQRSGLEKLEGQLLGPQGGLSQKSKDLVDKANQHPASREKLQRQIEKDLKQRSVMVKLTPLARPYGGEAPVPPGTSSPSTVHGQPVATGNARDGVIDGKTKKKVTQNDRSIGQDGSSVDR
jgi:predicted double-glycine peptidase